MKAPKLYWVCLAYLILLVLGTDYSLIAHPPPVAFPCNAIVYLIGIFYNVATITLLLRRKLTVPTFLLLFATFALGETWAIVKTGLSPGVRSPQWLAIHAAPFLIVVAIVYYCYRLTKSGFLR